MRLVLAVAGLVLCAGCHEGVKMVPLVSRTISITDRFFDVQALSADHAVVVGYGGKILVTDDAGFSWTQMPSGTTQALYRVHFVDPNDGWIAGQNGLILHTTDGGKTWQPQQSGTQVYLFSLSFVDREHGWAVGDRSILLSTVDGGAHWSLHKIIPPSQRNLTPDEAIVSQDPILYDVQFLNPQTGWVVGEFGKIYRTNDGGRSWIEQEQTLLGAEVVDLLDLPTFFGVHFSDAENGLAAGLDGKLARTHDGGATWKFEKMQLQYPLADPLFVPFLFPDGTGFAVGAAGEVVKLETPNGRWHRVKLGMEVFTWMRGMTWLNHNDGWIVGGLGMILHTTDGGKSWVPSLG
jgi:photosystem II stability/assembly factor-like uncharacterized protein